jgi:HK97 family phage prohead protease
MGDDTMASEYTDSEQELAVCSNDYDSNKEDSIQNDEKHIRAIEETDDSYIIEFGKSKMDSEEEVEETASKEENEKESIEIKSSIKAYHDDDEEDKNYGTFEGYGSVFGNKDLGNDVIERGAFLKSLKKRKPQNVKLLYQHKSDMPIGVFDEIREDNHGLVVKGRLALKTQAGAEAYELLKMGALDGLSIGFRVNPKEVSYDKRGNRRIIKEVDLMEVSLVTFPMNPQATVRSVKGEEISIREWENGLRDAFNLSRSEAKVGAKAVTDAFSQREVGSNAELVEAIKNLTLTLKS